MTKSICPKNYVSVATLLSIIQLEGTLVIRGVVKVFQGYILLPQIPLAPMILLQLLCVHAGLTLIQIQKFLC